MSMNIPQTDPRANYFAHRAEIDAAIVRVLEGGRYILGQEVAAFEREFAVYLGVKHGAGTGSGTEALHLALLACEVRPGDPVFTVSHTAVATVAAIELCGAKPVLVDIDPATHTMDPQRLEDAVRAVQGDAGSGASPSRRWGAVVPVHLYGHPADMRSILQIAKRYSLWVVEDCAQSHGATVASKRAGSLGHIAATSFYPTKNLGALGDGGLVATQDPELHGRVRLLREYGWRDRYVSVVPGLNSRLDEIQAAVLRAKLPYLDAENARRRELAASYDRLLAASGLGLPVSRPGITHVYHQYVIRSPWRDGLRDALREKGIGTLIHYPVPVHLQPAYAGRVLIPGSLDHTEAAAREILSLPMYAELSLESVEYVARQILDYYQKSSE